MSDATMTEEQLSYAELSVGGSGCDTCGYEAVDVRCGVSGCLWTREGVRSLWDAGAAHAAHWAAEHAYLTEEAP